MARVGGAAKLLPADADKRLDGCPAVTVIVCAPDGHLAAGVAVRQDLFATPTTGVLAFDNNAEAPGTRTGEHGATSDVDLTVAPPRIDGRHSPARVDMWCGGAAHEEGWEWWRGGRRGMGWGEVPHPSSRELVLLRVEAGVGYLEVIYDKFFKELQLHLHLTRSAEEACLPSWHRPAVAVYTPIHLEIGAIELAYPHRDNVAVHCGVILAPVIIIVRKLLGTTPNIVFFWTMPLYRDPRAVSTFPARVLVGGPK